MKRRSKKQPSRIQYISDPKAELENFRSLMEPEEFDLLVKEIDQPLLPAIRLNPLKAGADFADFLRVKYGWKLEVLPYCSSGYRVTTGNGPDVSSVLEHKLGMFYIQEAASMLPVELFNINPADENLCLDLAASPGGKTTHLISRLNDRGLVIANDSSQGRIPALRIVLQNWGAVGCAVTRFPGESFGAWYPDVFDKVLLDAPCSMQGLRIADSHTLRPVTEKESTQLSIRQTALLTSALQALRVGGEVVYSTCTLLPAEDEGVVNNLIRRFGSSIQLLDAQSVLPSPAPGIIRTADLDYSPQMHKTIRLWPHRYHTAGFFACILKKTGDLGLSVGPTPVHDMEKAGFHEMSPKDGDSFCSQFGDLFGFNLKAHLSLENHTLVRRDQKVYLFPQLLLDHFRNLPVQSAGLLIGEDMPDGFLPSQAWVSRFGNECSRSLMIINEIETRHWMNGENLDQGAPAVEGSGKYVILLTQDRQALGCGKVTGRGIRNLLPRRLI